MARKRIRIVSKALDFLAVGFSPMAKVKKPIARKLLLFKRTKRFRLLRHYNYAFIAEYEFSPSNSPLFRYPPAPPPPPLKKKKKKTSRFLSLLCGGAGAESATDGGAFQDEVEASSLSELVMLSPDADRESPGHELLEYGDEEDEATIDQRAERFIQKFYKDMRIQKQKSDAARGYAP